MKKSVFMVLIFLLTIYANAYERKLERGAINFGGNITYSSFKYNENDDASNTFQINTKGGFFVSEHVTFDFMLGFAYASNDEHEQNIETIGIGSRLFLVENFYLGTLFERESRTTTNEDDNETSIYKFYATGLGGLLFPIIDYTVCFNVEGTYKIGFGEYGGDLYGDNEESMFGVWAGLQFFF